MGPALSKQLDQIAHSKAARRFIVALLLVLHALLCFDTLRRKSATVDEVGHLPAGVSYLQKRSFKLYHHNPPLIKLICGAAALATSPEVDYSRNWDTSAGMPASHWGFGFDFMLANADRYQTVYTAARTPVIAVSLLAAIVIYLWASELFGTWAGFLALSLWCLSPNTITHAGMVTTDMGATAIGFVTSYFFWRYLRQPSYRRAVVVGVWLGLAQLTKYSLLLLFPLLGLIWIAVIWKKNTIRVEAQRALIALMICVSIINAGYLFEGSGKPLGQFEFYSATLTTDRTAPNPTPPPAKHPLREVIAARVNRFQDGWFHHLPVPLPEHYVLGFDEQKFEAEGGMTKGGGYPMYLCGEMRRSSWWWYYAFALLIKVPLGTWALLIAGAIMFTRRGWRVTRLDECMIAIPAAAILLAMSFLTNINLGLRYVLPLFPFCFVFVGRVWRGAEQKSHPGVPWLCAGLAVIAWNAVELRHHPHHLAYFNHLVGGPDRGGDYLIDSNLDWGQDLFELQDWLETNRPDEKVQLAYFGNIDPSILAESGFRFELAAPSSADGLQLLQINTRNDEVMGRIREWEAENAEPGLSRTEAASLMRRMTAELFDLNRGPQPGLCAISANFVYGLPFRLRDQHGNIWNTVGADQVPIELTAYGYFQKLKPIAKVGYSIFVYDLDDQDVAAIRKRLAK